jgi:hypothetical protein
VIDLTSLIREARDALGAAYDVDTLYGYVAPQLSQDDISALVRAELWNRSLGISAKGRYDASRAAAMGNEPEDYDFASANQPVFGRGLQPKPQKPRRRHGQARAETASLVSRIVTRWLDQYSALGSSTGEKRLAEYTSSEFRAMAAAKRGLAATYGQQAASDDEIALLMDTLHCDRADELPAESLYQVIRSYRPISGTAGGESSAEPMEQGATA